MGIGGRVSNETIATYAFLLLKQVYGAVDMLIHFAIPRAQQDMASIEQRRRELVVLLEMEGEDDDIDICRIRFSTDL